jgi:transcriptional regulator with XRE-family HTH domain
MLPLVEHLGDVIKRRRQILSLSQAELAEGAGVHLRQIRRYESGEQQPVLAVAARLAGMLEVSLREGGAQAEGRWVGLAADGSLVSGHAALARTREDAQAIIARVTA